MLNRNAADAQNMANNTSATTHSSGAAERTYVDEPESERTELNPRVQWAATMPLTPLSDFNTTAATNTEPYGDKTEALPASKTSEYHAFTSADADEATTVAPTRAMSAQVAQNAERLSERTQLFTPVHPNVTIPERPWESQNVNDAANAAEATTVIPPAAIAPAALAAPMPTTSESAYPIDFTRAASRGTERELTPEEALAKREYEALYSHNKSAFFGSLLIAAPLGILSASYPLTTMVLGWLIIWILAAIGLNYRAHVRRQLRRSTTNGNSSRKGTVQRVASFPWHLAKAFVITLPRGILLCVASIALIFLSSWIAQVPFAVSYLQFGNSTIKIYRLLADPQSPSGFIIGMCVGLVWFIMAWCWRLAALRIAFNWLAQSFSGREHPIQPKSADRPFFNGRSIVIAVLWLVLVSVAALLLNVTPVIDWTPITSFSV